MDWKELLEGKAELEKGTDEKIRNEEVGTEHTGDTENTQVEVPESFKIYSPKTLNRKSCISSTLTYV